MNAAGMASLYLVSGPRRGLSLGEVKVNRGVRATPGDCFPHHSWVANGNQLHGSHSIRCIPYRVAGGSRRRRLEAGGSGAGWRQQEAAPAGGSRKRRRLAAAGSGDGWRQQEAATAAGHRRRRRL